MAVSGSNPRTRTPLGKVAQEAGPNLWLYAEGAFALVVIFVCIYGFYCRKKKGPRTPPPPPAFDIEAPPAFDIEAPPARPRRKRRESRLNFPDKLMKNVRRRSQQEGYSRSGSASSELPL